MSIISKRERANSLWIMYDLSDPNQFAQASEDRRAWGKRLTEVHELDNDHILIHFFHPGGAMAGMEAPS